MSGEVARDFALFVHEYLREQIAFADQKAALVFAAASAFLAYLHENGAIARLFSKSHRADFVWLVGLVGVSALSLAAVFALGVVLPRLRGSRSAGRIFWPQVRRAGSAGAYSAEVARLDMKDASDEISRHAFDLAGVASSKFRVLGVALVVGALGFICAIAYLLIMRGVT